MSRRCKPGTRARILRGGNAGKIVVVVRRYLGEEINDATWPKALFPWVVTSLSGPLRSVYVNTGQEAPGSLTVVADDRDLEPLSDDDPGEAGYANSSKRHVAPTVVADLTETRIPEPQRP